MYNDVLSMCLRNVCVRRHVYLIGFIVIPLVSLLSCKTNPHENLTEIARVDVHPESSGNDGHSDLNAVIQSASPGTHIVLPPGKYVVDNPITMKQKGLRVIGSGNEKTLLVPRNVGRSIFRFQADGLGVENIGMNAEIEDREGRATFAILIEDGYGNCEIRNTRIENTGASAVIGHSADDCMIDNNIIINSGDDAIQLRGRRIKITNNIMVRYFDEGIDVARGENIVVSNNFSISGRIGIVVDDSRNASISGNIVEDQVQEGIVLGSNQGGIVENNAVRDSKGIAFHLHSPMLVRSNFVAGENAVGFGIRGMKGGILEENTIADSGLGIELSASTGNLVRSNRFVGSGKFLEFDEGSTNDIHGNLTYDDSGKRLRHDPARSGMPFRNRSFRALAGERLDSYDKYRKLAKLLSAAHSASHTEGYRVPGENIAVQGKSNRDRESADGIAKLLMRNNPGYLTIEIAGNVMKSSISYDLYRSLKRGERLAIGLVRVPFLSFSNVNGSYFPLWQLYHEDTMVAVVSRKRTGANVEIYICDNGSLDLRNTVSLWKNRLIAGLIVAKNRLMSRMRS